MKNILIHKCRDPSPWCHVTRILIWIFPIVHVARLLLSGLLQGDLIRITPIRISPRVHVARFSYPNSLKERHTTLINITSGQPTYTVRIYFVRIVDWSKRVLHVIITACHGPRSATCRVKGQEGSDDKSLPTISNSHDASHDLCQPPVGWWWPCHHLVSSWQHKISPYN